MTSNTHLCKSIGCNKARLIASDFCHRCGEEVEALTVRLGDEAPASGRIVEKQESSGSDNDYWLLEIQHPKRLEPYTAECEDIIEALEMSFQEGEAFKAIWRKCGQRLGNGKPGNTALRDAQKIRHFGARMEAIENRRLLEA